MKACEAWVGACGVGREEALVIVDDAVAGETVVARWGRLLVGLALAMAVVTVMVDAEGVEDFLAEVSRHDESSRENERRIKLEWEVFRPWDPEKLTGGVFIWKWSQSGEWLRPEMTSSGGSAVKHGCLT